MCYVSYNDRFNWVRVLLSRLVAVIVRFNSDSCRPWLEDFLCLVATYINFNSLIKIYKVIIQPWIISSICFFVANLNITEFYYECLHSSLKAASGNSINKFGGNLETILISRWLVCLNFGEGNPCSRIHLGDDLNAFFFYKWLCEDVYASDCSGLL